MTRARAIPDSITVHVPFRLVKCGGRKEIVVPPGTPAPWPRIDDTLVKALARAFRWKHMLESGDFATTAELAAREGIAPSCVSRIMRLTLLAPDIVEAILEGEHGARISLARLMEPFPHEWEEQRTLIR